MNIKSSRRHRDNQREEIMKEKNLHELKNIPSGLKGHPKYPAQWMTGPHQCTSRNFRTEGTEGRSSELPEENSQNKELGMRMGLDFSTHQQLQFTLFQEAGICVRLTWENKSREQKTWDPGNPSRGEGILRGTVNRALRMIPESGEQSI